MNLGTTRDDIVRAVCEGVAYAARHCLEAAGLEGEVAICGGAESAAWWQIVANVLGKQLRIARKPEVGARGAAMAALIAAEEDFDRAEWTRPEGYVEPDEEVADLYEEGFSHYTWLASRRHVVSGVVHRTPGCLSRESVTAVDPVRGLSTILEEAMKRAGVPATDREYWAVAGAYAREVAHE